MKKPFKIGVLASTKGTDLQAIIDEINEGRMPGIEIAIVLSNNKKSYALERSRMQGVKAYFVDPSNKTEEEFDEELAKILKEHEVDLLCLIGYARILTPNFVRQFPRRIINVHPALMPKYSGPGYFKTSIHEAVLENKEKETGCTIHFVTEEVDAGEIIVQDKVAVSPDDTPETLQTKVQGLEKKWYPEVIRRFAKGEIS
jgi:phosphoribosylglycinamide formyltransferase-1